MDHLTFEKLPQAVSTLSNEINELKRLIVERQESSSVQQEKLLTVEETAKFLNLTVPTIYSKVSRGELPYMKRSKRLYFSSLELMNYLREGRSKSSEEIEQEAECYLVTKKRGLENGN